MEKKVCILSFSPIYQDARVLRQIKYLSPYFDLTVIGYGHPHSNWINTPNVRWIQIGIQHNGALTVNRWVNLKQRFIKRFKGTFLINLLKSIARRVRPWISYIFMFLGRFHPFFYEVWYWKKDSPRMEAFKYSAKSGCIAFHANDWTALPAAAEAAKINNAKLIFDAH